MPNSFTCIYTLESFECVVVDSQIFKKNMSKLNIAVGTHSNTDFAVPKNRVNIQTLTFPSRAVFNLRFHFFNYTIL